MFLAPGDRLGADTADVPPPINETTHRDNRFRCQSAVLSCLVLSAAFGADCRGSLEPRPSGPPATPKRPAIDVYHGVVVTDDYRWLEDWSRLAVRQWSDAQNAY